MAIRDIRKKRLFRATILYWTLLIYIVAALVWWFITLENQNEEQRNLRTNQLQAVVDSTSTPGIYESHLRKINSDHKRN